MSKAIQELREHFNQMPVPNSKVLMEERDRVNAMIDAVEIENANLRELVGKIWKIACHASCIDVCEYYYTCMKQYDENGCMYRHRMRELGIEVDG